MNNTVAYSVAGVLCTALGATCGYFYAKYKLEAGYEERLSTEEKNLRTRYYNIGVEREEDVKDKLNDKSRELDETKEYLEDLISVIKKKYKIDDVYAELDTLRKRSDEAPKNNYTNYNKLAHMYVDEFEEEDSSADILEPEIEEEEVVEEIDPIIADLPKDEEQKEPYFINQRMFEDNVYNHEKTQVSYFIKDDFVVDSEDSMLSQTHLLFGDLLSKIPKKKPKTLYFVRNNGLKLDIEIEIIESSYEDVVGSF